MDPQPARAVLLTAIEAAPMLGIAPGTIAVWHSRGHLEPAGQRATGRRPAFLYRWGDLMDCQARHLDNAGEPFVNRS